MKRSSHPSLYRLRMIAVLLFYTRVPWQSGLLMALVAPIAVGCAPGMLGNIFLVATFQQVVLLTFLCFFAASVLTMQFEVVRVNGPLRFPDLSTGAFRSPKGTSSEIEPGHCLADTGLLSALLPMQVRMICRRLWCWNPLKSFLWLLMSISIPLTCLWNTCRSSGGAGASDAIVEPPQIDWTSGLLACLLGFVFFYAISCQVSWLTKLLVHRQFMIVRLLPTDCLMQAWPRPYLGAIGRTIGRWLYGDGYAETQLSTSGEMLKNPRPGHVQLACACTLVWIAHAVLFKLTPGRDILLSAYTPFAVPFCLVLLIVMWSSVLSGLAFLLDYYRVPVLFAVILVLVGMFWCRPDLEDTFEALEYTDNRPVTQLNEVFGAVSDRIPQDRQNRRTLVVITAPGGGIHASAWTARVLTGLHERYGSPYAKSLGLISSVSGGSIGTTFYLAEYEEMLPLHDGSAELKGKLDQVNKNARASSLEAIAWGLSILDFSRTMWSREQLDRGRLQEMRWGQLLGPARSLTLRGWGDRIRLGKMPLVAFNATEVDTGRRVIFSPVVAGARTTDVANPELATSTPLEFTELYKLHDLNIVTAARMSATFPYVSPIAEARPELEKGIRHVADGGYVDNEGILTAVDWVNRLVQMHNLHRQSDVPFHRVLFLRIQHEPPPRKQTTQIERDRLEGWNAAAIGPLQAVLAVRGTSQIERGQIEIGLLEDSLQLAATANNHEPSHGARRVAITVESLFVTFQGCDEKGSAIDFEPPLSWKLTPEQQLMYDRAWRELERPKAVLEQLDEYFEPISNVSGRSTQ